MLYNTLNKIVSLKYAIKTMSAIEKYLKEKYLNNRWPFFNYIHLKNQFGESGVSDLKRLKEEEKIKIRKYINGYLIEIINFEKWIDDDT